MFAWVIAMALLSLRLGAEGPDWGIRLAPAPDGVGAVAAAVRGQGIGWEQGIRPGDRVLSADGEDASRFVGEGLGPARRLIVADAGGRERVAAAPHPARPLLLALVLASLTFAVLGVAVHRWVADPALGAIFLLCCGASATALEVIPGALMGSAWANLLAASSSVVAAPAFAAVFLRFPRPLRWARPVALVLAAITACLVASIVALFVGGSGTPPALDSLLFAWLAANLLGGAGLLTARAINSAHRHTLAPIVIAVGLGVTPLALMNALPRALGQPPILPVEVAAVGAVAIPLGFAYAISRHRLFALDAQLRGLLVRLCAGTATVSLFVVIWLTLRTTWLDDQLAVVTAVAVAALAAPIVSVRVERALDAWLYPPLQVARSEPLVDRAETALSVASTVAARVRELVPTRWAACFVRDSASLGDQPLWRVVGASGDVPPSLFDDPHGGRAFPVTGPEGATVLPIERSGTRLAVVVVGPRLDGTPLGGVDVQTIRLLARSAAAPLEAALLRERAEEETRFREGLAQFARDLAAVGSVEDVLRLTASHAVGLLSADRATLWLGDPGAGFTRHLVLGDAGRDGAAPAPAESRCDLTEPLGGDQASRLRRERVARGALPVDPEDPAAGGGPLLAFAVGEPGLAEALVLLCRDRGAPMFTAQDEQRASEIADHAVGALRRAQMSDQAAEVEALRELDQVRTEVMDLLAHDLQNPLTALGAHGYRLRLKADALDPSYLAEAGGRIQALAARAQGLVRDLVTSTRYERGRLALRPERVETGQFLARLAANYRPLPGGDRLRVDAPEPIWSSADPARLEQAVGNLLQNALRYAPTGPVTLRARPGASDEVWIEVRDQGPGIPPEEQPHVWEKFYRTPYGARATRAGSGIGLWVVRTLAELHGGRAELDSTPGEGSTFRIVLPRAEEGE
ncbi:MAG TPA: HAMP domain-containing sensor histidine kinase [Chloroflexota bacterium]|nr:HAMP domain-containing sensor histidine kinase [Chloroflexota bacterium]